ncbi:MAG: hypothetical protein M0002_07180 [Rhodospirillales bacterium]|nr:hypothetical protein [Rhodospirillales bacterium]
MLSLSATRANALAALPTGRAAARPRDGSTDLRQLRHLTKNALQRILVQVREAPGLGASAAGRSLAREIERRVKLSAAISDSLFGLTQCPEPLPERLRTLCRSVVDLYADPAQIIRVDVVVGGILPGRLEAVAVRVVHELVGNAVKHGMHMRLIGQILVRLDYDAEGYAVLTVENDGWPIDGELAMGDGLHLVAELAASAGGRMRIRNGTPTAIEVRLPASARP